MSQAKSKVRDGGREVKIYKRENKVQLPIVDEENEPADSCEDWPGDADEQVA